MKNHIIFSCLLASIIPHAHAMQSGNLSYKEEFELKREAAQNAMATLNNYLDLNRPNPCLQKAVADAVCIEALKTSKHYWYDAKPLLHATIALKLAEIKACHAAKLSCERVQDLVKRPSQVAREEHETLCCNERDLQAFWINAELNLATIQKFEKSFKEEAKYEEQQRNLNNFQTRH